MVASLSKPVWTEEYETEILNKLAAQHAPYLLNLEKVETRPPQTQEEKENFARFRIAGAAHDLFIVQVIAKAIAQLIHDPHWQLSLSRQLGDDGAHSLNSRLRVQELLGYDPIDQIQQQVQEHWEFMGDSAVRDWLGFAAFQVHYELHVVGPFLLQSRVGRISDPKTATYFVDKILPDEAAHRLAVIDWWKQLYDKASPNERSELAAQLLERDEEIQQRRTNYLIDHWDTAHKAKGITGVDGINAVYDGWRREVLAYLIDTPVEKLPKLLSVSQ
ncbi:hypothetical protein [Nostoc sp. NMS8]|uniref:hypothetical protein n=1 Tax=Nostoc sp. NMS8 TaxID=2815392 RepID=UPI0025EF1DCC|nr:hypothetical protein [Nostoc sp. NMS8]MBN3960885.1 hypothetical protein [Nostoc sp. NMS8]